MFIIIPTLLSKNVHNISISLYVADGRFSSYDLLTLKSGKIWKNVSIPLVAQHKPTVIQADHHQHCGM